MVEMADAEKTIIAQERFSWLPRSYKPQLDKPLCEIHPPLPLPHEIRREGRSSHPPEVKELSIGGGVARSRPWRTGRGAKRRDALNWNCMYPVRVHSVVHIHFVTNIISIIIYSLRSVTTMIITLDSYILL
jgi:hypothetical protein